jgi:hypothetical protein
LDKTFYTYLVGTITHADKLQISCQKMVKHELNLLDITGQYVDVFFAYTYRNNSLIEVT